MLRTAIFSSLSVLFNPFGISSYFVPNYENYFRSKKDIERTAYHEAGHALANHFLNTNSKLLKVSCISGRNYYGRCSFELNLNNSANVEAHIVYLMAGIAGEKIFMGSEYRPRGAHADIEEARFFIKELTGGVSKSKVKSSLETAECAAFELLLLHREKLELLATCLLEKGELDANEINILLGEKRMTQAMHGISAHLICEGRG